MFDTRELKVIHSSMPPPGSELVGEISGTYKWVIKDWSKVRKSLKQKRGGKYLSQPFILGGINW